MEQQLPFEKHIDFTTEAITPRATTGSYGHLEEAHQNSSEVITCELVASQATKPSVGDGRVLGESGATTCFSRKQNQSTAGRYPVRDDRSTEIKQIAHVGTCKRIPATIRGDDWEVGVRSALLTGC